MLLRMAENSGREIISIQNRNITSYGKTFFLNEGSFARIRSRIGQNKKDNSGILGMYRLKLFLRLALNA